MEATGGVVSNPGPVGEELCGMQMRDSNSVFKDPWRKHVEAMLSISWSYILLMVMDWWYSIKHMLKAEMYY